MNALNNILILKRRSALHRSSIAVRYTALIVMASAAVVPAGALAESTGSSQSRTISAENLISHIKYLASDELQGRGLGGPGLEKASDYIADQFERIQLAPMGDDGSYIQPLQAPFLREVGPETNLEIRIVGREQQNLRLELDRDYRPLSGSKSGEFEGDLVLAGYGISAPDHEWDDYSGLDVAGKVVLVLRYEPKAEKEESGFGGRRPSRNAWLTTKAKLAAEKSAKAMILVNPPKKHYDRFGPNELMGMDVALPRMQLPVIHMTAEAADRILSSVGHPSAAHLQDMLDTREGNPRGAKVAIRVAGNVQIIQKYVETGNVLGAVPGVGRLKDEWIVVGAHYDHIGVASSQFDRSSPGMQIHNGADDNASGTAALIEIAGSLSRGWQSTTSDRRSVLFAAFTAEETGLAGSGHYVAHPKAPLAKTVLMVNLDMVGRLKKNRLTIFGARTGEGLRGWLDNELAAVGLEPNYGSDGFGPSDHASFYGKKIPAVHFFTGTHPDYHRPSDDWEKINFSGVARIGDLTAELVRKAATVVETIKFVAVPLKDTPTRGSLKARLGIMPDYGSDNDEGLGVAAASPGGPAERAGLQAGDLIVGIGDYRVIDVYSYMDAMKEAKPGTPIDVAVKRNGKRIKVTVTPE